MARKVEDYLLVAAIDFGTTYSGCAFSMRHEFVRDPTQINARTWTATSGKFQSLKTSTCILFNKDKTFHSFGFEAEDKYSELAEDDSHHGWYFFRRFKMQLYGAQNVHKDFPLESDNGTTLPAMKAFSESIRYLKNALLQDCKRQNTSLDEADIKWVLTVPAIWTDPAKTFMRAAAVQAGIPGERLTIALEPEAAALFVKHLPLQKKTEGAVGDSFTTFAPGQKYLVLDAGGGTIDIAVHEMNPDGTIREIATANGGSWGGTQVDASFNEFLEEIFMEDVMEEFQRSGKTDYLEMLRDFEVKKRAVRKEMDSKITIKIPTVLAELFKSYHPEESIAGRVGSHKYASNITVVRDKIRMDPVVVCSFFDRSLDAIAKHLKNLLKKKTLRHVDTILMVGGYSESPLLLERIKREIKGKHLIVPFEAGLVILKGAVLFGHDPTLIKQRISKFTYGIRCLQKFDPSIHPTEKQLKTKDGSLWCIDCFSRHVQINESITVGETQSKHAYFFDDYHLSNQTLGGIVDIYASSDPNPIFVTDKGCNKIGTLQIRFPLNVQEDKTIAILLYFSFSGTEIEIKAIIGKTGHEFTTHVDFST